VDDGSPSQSPAERLDRVCDRFEDAWLAGQRPRIEDYLQDVAVSERSALLDELLRLELDYRVRLGECPTAEEYRLCFPGHAEGIDAVLAALVPQPGTEAQAPGRADVSGPGEFREELDVVAVLRADQVQRWQRGERVPVETYLQQITDLPSSPQALLDLVCNEIRLRRARGELPGLEEYVRRFPQCEEQIRRQFTTETRQRPARRQTQQAATDAAGRRAIPEEHPSGSASPGRLGAQDQSQVEGGAALLLADPSSGGSGAKDQLQVPGYEILEEIGRGGMGVVYKARQVKADRVVALKMILSGGYASEADLLRFRTEAEAIARLQHPHIVQVFEVGEHEGRPFFSLEFCPGGSLDRQLDGTPLQPKQAARLVKTLARAVHAAHEKNVIHRDLKPANVLLTESGQPKITDFGLAKKIDETGRTASGAIMGTPSYMAPEQAGGQSKDIGPAADIYALGAILYELLTGRPPFKAATPLDTMLQVLSDEPVSPRQLQPKTPMDMETICLKCLHKEPKRRYATAQALAEDLARFQTGKPVQARPVGRLERSWRWCSRNPAVAALVFTLLLGTSMTTVLAVVANQNAEEARKQLDVAREYQLTAQLAKVEAMRERDPDQAQELLHDTNACPIHLRDFAWRLFETGQKPRFTHSKVANPVWGVCPIAFSSDGLKLVSGSSGGIALWDVETGRELASLWGTGEVRSVAFRSDGLTVVSGGVMGIALWDVKTGKVLAHSHRNTKDGFAGQFFSAVAFSNDGDILASGGDETIRLWYVNPGHERPSLRLLERLERNPLKGHREEVTSVAFSSNGQTLASGSADKTIKLWNVNTGEDLQTLKGHMKGVTSVAFSSDGQTLASGSQDKTVKLWNVKTGQLRATLQGHTGGVTSVAFSSDGQTLASGSHDKTVTLWNVKTGQLRATLQGHREGVNSVAFSSNGQTLASGGKGGILLWDIELPHVQTDRQGFSLNIVLLEAVFLPLLVGIIFGWLVLRISRRKGQVRKAP
jgi:serine/threonine protein kinase